MSKRRPRQRRQTGSGSTPAAQGGALGRLRAKSPLGPPYVVLVLDLESAEALTYGAVNSRAMVAACQAVAACAPLPLPKDYPV